MKIKHSILVLTILVVVSGLTGAYLALSVYGNCFYQGTDYIISK